MDSAPAGVVALEAGAAVAGVLGAWVACRLLTGRRLPRGPETAAWLRRALANNLADEIRRLGASRRDVLREQSLQAALDQSSARLEAWLTAESSAPDAQLIRQEQALRLAQALAQLSEDQRHAVEQHHLLGRPVADVAAEMGRSPGAVGSLIARALKKLREHLQDSNVG